MGGDGARQAVHACVHAHAPAFSGPVAEAGWDLSGAVIHTDIPLWAPGPPAASPGPGWGTSLPSFPSLLNPREHLPAMLRLTEIQLRAPDRGLQSSRGFSSPGPGPGASGRAEGAQLSLRRLKNAFPPTGPLTPHSW